eukprot:jgi/Galph1/5141/GphlegSOOS_G3751.1
MNCQAETAYTNLDEQYLQAVSKVEELYSEIPKEQLLQLYGLYKRVKDGVAQEKNPYFVFQWKESAKWNSWKQASTSAKYMTYFAILREEAKQKYIDLVETYLPRRKESSIGKQPLGFDIVELEDTFSDNVPLDICYWAAIGDLASVKYVLENDPQAVSTVDSHLITPLMYSADRGYLEIVRLLLAFGAAVNATDWEGQSALHYACFCEHFEVAKELVQAGADIYLQDKYGQSSWDIASANMRSQWQ